MPATLDHFYTYGDLYETIEACDQLETLLGRLQRQHLLSTTELMESKREVADIRARIESHLAESRIMPKGPRLP